jgi:hypothetical protein
MKNALTKVLPLGLLVAASAAMTVGCSASTTATEEHTAHSSQKLDTSYYYDFSIDNVYIAKTRAPRNDSDVIGVSASVDMPNDNPADYGSNSFNLGDLNSQHYHSTGAQMPNVVVNPGDTAHFGFAIINSGLSHGTSGQVDSALNGVSDAAHDIVSKAYPIPYVWDYLNKGTHWLNQFFIGYCDGGVAADRIDIDADTLAAWTDGTGSYDEWRRYDGTNSPNGCGANSEYYVHWTITRRDIPNNGGM